MTKKALLLFTLLVTDIVLFGAIVRYFPLPADIDLQSKLVSAVLAHWFLLGFWLSFGAMKAPWRQAIATSLLAIVCAFAAPLDGVANMAAVRGLLILAVTWFFYAAMFFPRRLMGLRIGWREYESTAKSKSQFGLGVLLGFIAVTSVPLALSRLAFAMDQKLAWQALFEIALLLAPIAVVMLPFAIAVFAAYNRTLKLSLTLFWGIAATFVMRHFHPPTAGGQIFWEAVIAILALVFIQVTVHLFVARLMGLRWLGTGEPVQSAPQNKPNSWHDSLQLVTLQCLVIALAISAGVLIFFASEVLQFTVAFVIFIAAPCLIGLLHFWRRMRPNAFWTAFLISGALPWAGAFYLGATEAGALLWGTPVFASTSPVEVTPTCALDWPEVIAILFAPLAIGSAAGVLTLASQQSLTWLRRRRLAQASVNQATKTAAAKPSMT